MEHRTASTTSVATIRDLAKTLRYRREEITTKFTREPVDADDTVPVELYSRPYERLDIQLDSSPYERIEIERDTDALGSCATSTSLAADEPSSALRLFLAFSILCLTFALGVGFAFLVL